MKEVNMEGNEEEKMGALPCKLIEQVGFEF